MQQYAILRDNRVPGDEREQQHHIAAPIGELNGIPEFRRQLLQGLASEFFLLGLLAGVLASLAATVAGYFIARQVFQLTYTPDPGLWLAGASGGALGVGLFGVWGTRFILRQPPLQVLREL